MTAEGAPVAAGFLGSNIVLGTSDSGAAQAASDTDCTDPDGGDADLFLVTFPNGPGCLVAMDADGDELGREGVRTLATAEDLDRVVVSMGPPVTSLPGGSGPRLAAYDVEGENLTQAWTAGARGPVTLLDTDPDGTRTVATVRAQGGSNPAYRFNVYDASGQRASSTPVPGVALALTLSENGRYAAVAGNFTQGGSQFGWIELYDLDDTGEDPVFSTEIERAGRGVVRSVAVTDDGRVLAGTAGGRVYHLTTAGASEDIRIHNGTAHVGASPEGATLIAAAGDRVTRLALDDDGLRALWTRETNGTAQGLVLRAPYAFVASSALQAFDLTGEPLWERALAPVTAIDQSGRGIALARPTELGNGGDGTALRGAFVHASVQTSQPGDPPMISPGDVGVTNLTIRNTGASLLNLTLEPGAPPGVRIQSPSSDVVIRPDTERTIPLTVRVDRNVAPGLTEIPIRLADAALENATAFIDIDVGTETALAVQPEPGTLRDRAVKQGQQLTLRFVITNEGNADTSAGLAVQQITSRGGDWPVQLEPAGPLTLPRDTLRTVSVTVTVPDEARDGTMNRVILRALTDDGAAAGSVRLTVDPFEILEVQPTTVTKRVAPGGTSTFQFTIQNLGSVAANTTFDARAIGQDGQPYIPDRWGLVLDTAEATIEAGDSRTVTLEVSPSNNVTDGESLRVQLLTRSEAGARAAGVAFTVVDESLAEEPDEPKREPLGPGMAILGLLGATIVLATLRRSRDGKL